MKVQELFETSDEDRALISLSSVIYAKIKEHIGTERDLVSLGKVRELADTPLIALNEISIDIMGGEAFLRRLHDIPPEDVLKDDLKSAVAFWDEDADAVVFNRDFLETERMRTTVTHELRHALDSVKANKFPGDAKRYFTAKKKEHRKDDPYSTTKYRAQPAEINARFTEVLHQLSVIIPKRYKLVEPHLLRQQLTRDFNNLLIKYEIADLFPEKTKSPAYKRLIKRAYDFIQKEMAHIESLPDTTKRASGNW